MTFDVKAPEKLKSIQVWFGKVIARSLTDDNTIQPLSPSGKPINEEASAVIAASPTLNPSERIEVYNQQYWWRLLTTLQETFPLLTRLFGPDGFDRNVAVPFLEKYPPNHWALHLIANRLPQWLEKTYKGKDRSLVLMSAKIDLAYNLSFVMDQYPSIAPEMLSDPSKMEEIEKQKLFLQPHIYFFEMESNILPFRFEMMKQEAKYWLDHDFPKLEHFADNRKHHFIIYRMPNFLVAFDELDASEAALLRRFTAGCTIDGLCDWLSDQHAKNVITSEATEKLHLWFQRWISRGWLGIPKS